MDRKFQADVYKQDKNEQKVQDDVYKQDKNGYKVLGRCLQTGQK